MPMHPDPIAAPADRRSEPLWLVAVVTLGLLAGRLLAAGYGMFIENDETSLAAGIAALLRGSDGPLYRYGPQVGYYQLVVLLARLTGGDVLSVPVIQVTLSVLAGTIVPVLGLFAFRADLSRLERWLVAATLAASPILWMTSRYGSSAMVSVPLAFACLVILSNRPARGKEMLALALMAAAIFARADAVLVTPGVALLMWRNHGGLRPALLRFAGLGAAVATGYALLYLADPRMRSIAQDVGNHLATPFGTMFWEYMMWSVSPVPLILAVVGLRHLAQEQGWLLAVLAAWSVPLLAFYFPATTQPRYFLLPAFPLAIATAVGIADLVRGRGWRRRAVLGGVLLLANLHLLVGLGHFGSGQRRSFLTEASIETQVGPLWTGAFLYKSYWAPPLTQAPVFRPGFGERSSAERSIATALGHAAAGEFAGQHVLLLFAPRYGNTLHFYAQAAGVEILAKGEGSLFLARYAMRLGGADLTALGLRQLAADTTRTLPVAAGDIIWLFAVNDSLARSVTGRLDTGLAAVPDSQWSAAPRIWRFRVEHAPVEPPT